MDTDKLKEKLKKVVPAILGVYILYLLALGLISSPSGSAYEPQSLPPEATDQERARVMAEGVTHALAGQLDTLFGWLPNDLFFASNIIDNTANYQLGVIYATRPASDIIAKTAARYGKNDKLPDLLVDATSRYFTYSEKAWGFWFLYDCEGKYRAGIRNWQKWAESVGEGGKKAGVFNLKSDDIYDILKYCSNLTDYALGILNNQQASHLECDNNVYFVKGVCAVIGNVLRAVLAVDASVEERGGRENVSEALKRLDHIAKFSPLYVSAGGNDRGDAMLPNHVAALARHVDVANNRINDIMHSMEK